MPQEQNAVVATAAVHSLGTDFGVAAVLVEDPTDFVVVPIVASASKAAVTAVIGIVVVADTVVVEVVAKAPTGIAIEASVDIVVAAIAQAPDIEITEGPELATSTDSVDSAFVVEELIVELGLLVEVAVTIDSVVAVDKLILQQTISFLG